jgi:hypothetical protein
VKTEDAMIHVLTRRHEIRLARFIEPGLIVLGFFGLYLPLAYFAPVGTFGGDVFSYMDIGINGTKDVSTAFNRYFHVFLQRIFMKTAVTPLAGAQHYWAFLISATCLMVYIDARAFSRRTRFIHGLLAVALFLSIEYFGLYAGITVVDLTAMMIVMVLVTIYLFSARNGNHLKWLIALLGFFFYLAFKTKETSLPFSILCLGLGFTDGGGFNWKGFVKNMLVLLAGFLAGMAIFAAWTWIVVGDPLFGLRPSEFMAYYVNYAAGRVWYGNPESNAEWYTFLFSSTLLLPAVLYIISGFKSKDLDPAHRLIWLAPLLLLFFLDATVGNLFNLQERFAYPLMPLICLLGVQCLDFDFIDRSRERNTAAALFAVGLIGILFVHVLFVLILPSLHIEVTSFQSIVFYPFLLGCILATFFFIQHPGFKSTLLVVLFIVAMIAAPLISNYRLTFDSRANKKTETWIFYPYSAFASQIVFSPGMRMFVSTGTWTAVGQEGWAKNTDKILTIFNVYFSVHSHRDNFTYAALPPDQLDNIFSSNYTYLLLTAQDWKSVQDHSQFAALADQKYQVFTEPKNLLVLLKLR